MRARATIDASLELQLGNPSGASADSTNHNHFLIQRTVESLDFSDSLGEPNWASWDLTGSDIGSAGRSSTFYADTTLPADFYEVTSNDYTNSGYDRGHMCPSLDRTDTTVDNKLVFYMSNIIPQTADNNEGVWESFESYCQTQAQNGNELLLICGPSNFNGTDIPSGKAAIPGYTWKIAVIVPAGSGTAASRVTVSTRVISLKIPNISGVRSDPWTNYVTSANQIQADTGFTFFTSLSASVATALRAKVDSSSTAPTPAPAISSFSPASGPVGSSVILAGSGLTSASAVKFNGVNASAFTVNSDTQLTATVPTGATTGTIAVTTPGGTAVSSGTFTITAGGGLVISQVYGGGGNSGATYTNDFIELYNAGSSSVNLSNYAVQYASATGSSWSATNLSGTVAAGHYYLVQEAAGSTTVKALPTPEATGTVNLSSASGKVALTNTQTLLTTSNPVGTATVIDFVGYGTANAYEGSGAAPTLTSSTAAERGGSGTMDTNDNSADFTAATPVPHN